MSSHIFVAGHAGSSALPSESNDLSLERKAATIAAAAASGDAVYIDWGPDLPARYAGGRARVLVANPTTLFVAWETDRAAPDLWSVVVAIDGADRQANDVPGKTPDVWLQVPAGARGNIHLVRVDGGTPTEVAVMPWRTPPDGPSWRTDERWGRVDAGGGLHVDVTPPDGARVDIEAPVGMVAAIGGSGTVKRQS